MVYFGYMTPEEKIQRFWEILGEKIRSRRDTDLKRSLEDVAEHSETGISKSSLSLMETGKQQISTIQFFELSRILDFSPTDILSAVEKDLLSEQYSDLNKVL